MGHHDNEITFIKRSVFVSSLSRSTRRVREAEELKNSNYIFTPTEKKTFKLLLLAHNTLRCKEVCVCVCVRQYPSVCECVCECEREREREKIQQKCAENLSGNE